jgi:hypothetical protein
MFSDWFAAAGVVAVVGIVGVLNYLCSTEGNNRLPPWEAYQRALNDAQTARGLFLRDGFFAITNSLKEGICSQLRKWDLRLCPLCC